MNSSSLATLPELFATGSLLVDGQTATLPQMITVRQMVAQHPHRARVFESYGIVYCCCEGNKTFWDACTEHNVDPNQVLLAIQRSDAEAQAKAQAQQRSPCTELESGELSELRRHISEVHYTFLHTELPRLSYLIARVANRHGSLYPELWDLQALFEEFREEVESHLQREENYLFPLLQHLGPPQKPGDALHVTISKEICTLELEHEYVYRTLSCLNSLTSGFQAPETACNTSKVMLYALNQLSSDMHCCMAEERQLFLSLGFAL